MSNTDIATETRVKIKEPSLYKVVLQNDDFTPMEFVIQVLMQIFAMDEPTAHKVTMQIHNEGRGVCGVFSKEVAETKVYETMMAAKSYGYPLLAQVEKD